MSRNPIIWNKRAGFDYQILETFQAGLLLNGKTLEMIRSKKVNLAGKYIIFQNSQLQLIGLGSEDSKENVTLLLKKNEKEKIRNQIKNQGISCVPINIKRVGRWFKAEIALVKGRNLASKKRLLMDKDLKRELEREQKMTRMKN